MEFPNIPDIHTNSVGLNLNFRFINVTFDVKGVIQNFG